MRVTVDARSEHVRIIESTTKNGEMANITHWCAQFLVSWCAGIQYFIFIFKFKLLVCEAISMANLLTTWQRKSTTPQVLTAQFMLIISEAIIFERNGLAQENIPFTNVISCAADTQIWHLLPFAWMYVSVCKPKHFPFRPKVPGHSIFALSKLKYRCKNVTEH